MTDLRRSESAEIFEALRHRLCMVPIRTIVMPHDPRLVGQRNTGDRPAVADAVLLDDVWKALEDVLLAEEGS